MPQFDLSTLSAPELRQLLDSARARGHAAQSYQILQEMAARREHADKSLRRRPAEPRVIDMDLGDPLERKGEPLDLAEQLPPLAEPLAPASEPVEVEPLGPLYTAPEPTPKPAAAAKPPPPAPPIPRAPRKVRRTPWLASGLAAGLAAGVGIGWLAGDIARDPALAAPPPSKATLQVAVNADPVVGVLAPPTAAAPPAPAPVEVAAVEPVPPPEPAEAPAPAVEETPPEEAPIQVAARTEPTDACASAPTPADRIICADPDLQRLQRELRQAYAEALQAHQDRTLLRQRQLAWRDARSTVSDPGQLARLYEQRIKKLTAAAAEARRAS